MSEDKGNLYKLWSNVSQEYELPDFETFKADMQDTTKRRKLYEAVSADYELPDYDSFQADMGFTAAPAPVAEKKKDIQPTPKPKQEAGGGFGAGLDRQYLDHFVTATDNVAKKFQWKDTTDEDAYFNVLKRNNKFSDEQIGYIREQYNAKKGEWKVGVSRLGKKEVPAVEKPGIVVQKRDSTATAAEAKREAEDQYSEYRKKVKDESLQYYMQNPDMFGDNFVAGYESYLQEKMPAEYQQIKQKKEAGRWDVGADPATKIYYENLGRQIGIPGMAAGYEVAAEIMGTRSSDDSARLYAEALNWKAETERDAFDKLSKSPVMQQAQALQREQEMIYASPAGTQLAAADKALRQLQQQPEVQEYVQLSEKGAVNGNKLEGSDWKRYQQLKQAPAVNQYAKAAQAQQAVMNTPEGQQLAKINQQLQALSQNPQFKQTASALQKVQQNAAKTETQIKAYADKYPAQAMSEAYRKAEQQKVDAYYKRMNPVLKATLDVGTTLLRTPARALGEVTAGLARTTAGAVEFVTPEGALPGVTTGLNTTADLITSVSEGLNNNMFPQPSNLQMAMLDLYAPYKGYRVYTNSRNEVIDVRDGDGYRLPEADANKVIKQYEAEPKKPEKVYDPNMHTVLPKLTQTMADLYLLLQAPGVGATVGMGPQTSIVTYGYLQTYNSAYQEIKEADPFMSEEGAHLYANVKGLMNGEIWSLTPRALFKNVDRDLFFQDLGKEYTKILAGGATAKKAMSTAIRNTVLKNGLGEAAVELGIDLGDRALKLATNTITNRPTQEVEYGLSDFIETGLLSFAAGGIFSRLNNNKDNMTRDALYAGMKNFDATVQQMEQMANMGQITQQQYNNALGIMSRLKPVYDNLNDQTKYNDAYKATVLGLYADKLNIEDKINVSESYMVGKDPQRDLLVRQLDEIDQKIEMVTMVSAPDYVWTDGLDNEKRVTRAEVLEFMKDPIWLGLLKNGSYKLDVYNDPEIESLVNKYIPQEEVIEMEPEAEAPEVEVPVVTPTEPTAPAPKPEPAKPIMVADALGKKVKANDGSTGVIELTESGVYFTDENGNSRQLPVADKTNPTESLEELGLTLVQPKVRIPPAIPVELLEDNVSFNIGGEKLTWLKFNYGNNGELQTADMMRPDGSKVKLKDRDVVYDMAVQLSNSSRARLAVPNERASADIAEAVQPVKDGFDVGMKAIDTIFGDVDPAVETVLESLEMGMEVDADTQAAAELWLEDAIKRTEKIETKNVEEKQRVIEWAQGLLGKIGTAKIAAKRPVQPEPTAERPSGEPAAEGKPITPAEQRVYEFPELPSRAKALVKRLAGGKGEAEAERIVTTIKEAYQAEKAPKEELAKIGYAKQEYEKAIGEIVEALKPTVKTVPAEEKTTVPTIAKASKQELVSMIEDGTAKDMIEAGSLDMLEFMRMVDKFELPMPKWFQSMQETLSEEIGYTTEAEDAELLGLINKAYARTGVPEMLSRSETEGERLSTFKEGDIVFRDYSGRYEEYRIVKAKGSIWKLENTQTGITSDWNADANDGFILKPKEEALKPTAGGPEYIEGNPVAGTAEVGQYRPEFMGNVIEMGKATTIILPNGERIPAKYALVKLGDIIPSHDPFAFIKSKGYPVDTQGRTTNDRDYERDQAAQATTIQYGANPDTAKLLDLSKSPATGPSVITTDGFVVGGNGRVITMNRMSAANGVRYNTDLAQQASDFGLTSVPTYNAKQPIAELPVVVRIAETTDQYSKANSAKYNAEEGKAKSEADTSLTFGANLSENPRAKELIYAEIGKHDTMGQFFADPRSAKLAQQIMLSNDLVQQKDINRFFDSNGRWTTTGKELFRQGVFATLFNEDIVRLIDTPGVTSFIDKIGKSLPAVAENFNLPADKNLKKELEDAIRFQSGFVSSGMPNVTDYIRQMPMFEAPYLEQAMLWALIDISTAKNNYFRQALDSYNSSATADTTSSLFQDEVARTKQEFFTLITKNIPENVKQAIQSSLASQGFISPSEGEISEPYERYNAKRRDGGLLGFTANEPVSTQVKVGASKEGPIERQALINFVKAVGVRENGTVTRKLGEHYGDIMAELSRIPGNIEVFRDMARGGKAITSNVFRFKIDGVPFNPIEYINTGRIQGTTPEGGNIVREQNLGQEAGDTGFNEREINYRQGQFNFDDNPDTRSVEVKNDIPLKFRSVAEILDESIEKTGKELTDALAESKLKRKLEKGEYILKTSKLTVSKDWDIWRNKGQIKSPADVAYIFRKLEDYNNEHVMLAILDKDGNLHVAHVSSGSASASIASNNAIIDYALSFNADKMWWIHNHPAGAFDPSVPDVRVNNNLRIAANAVGIDFQGGIIVDWDKSAYTYIDQFGNIVDYGKSYFDIRETAPAEQVPVYQNFVDSRNETIPTVKYTDPRKVIQHVSSIVTQAKTGEAAKGGVLLLNNQLRILGNLFLNGHDDVATIAKGIAATNATAIITYGTFSDPVILPGKTYLDARVIDHIVVESKSFGEYNLTSTESPDISFSTPANDIPNVQELTLPYGDNASKLEKAVQKAMIDGFVTFDEVILNLYSDFYQGDAAKIRQNLQKIKDAYDEVSLLDEFMDSAISSIDEVARFDLDRFLINVNRPQRTEVSLRQQYNDFASWFEYNYPQYKFYYSIDIDPNNGQVYFRIGKDAVKMTNGNVLYYGDWLGNKKWQKDWNDVQKSEMFNRPKMIWVDQEITPVPFAHVASGQYAIGEDQEVAVNLILDRFIPKTPGKEPKRGFMLGDGMGIGKTRIELVSANEMVKAKGLPVLIITKGANVVEQFQREAAALSLSNVMYRQEPKNVNDAKIVVGTYEDLTGGKLGNADKYGAVVFDEAHMLKNTGTQRSMTAQEFLQKAEHVVFATGTPMDKPVQLAYFIQHMTGKDIDESLKPVGLFLENGVLKRRKDAPSKSLKELFLMWRSNMIKEGAYIRREYPFFGTADKVYIEFNDTAVGLLEQIKRGNGRNGIMAANRYQEHLKIPYVFSETLKAVNEGKQVVIFCVGVNDTIIYPDGKRPKRKGEAPYAIEVPQFASEFSQRLKEAGIQHAKIFGPDAAGKLEESRKFQRGDVKVAIATISSGGTGIDLDDQFGDAPREVIFATLPWSGNEFDQAQFRVSRRNTKTPSRMRFLFAANSWADEHKEALVSKKMETLRLIQAGKDPDVIDMERWREDADGGLIDIVEDDFNDQDENVSNPMPNQFVQAFPGKEVEITETPSEVKDKFEKGDPATLQAAGMLPAPIGGDAEYIKVTPENQADPEQEGDIQPTTPLGAGSTKGQPTTIGGAKTQPTVQRRRARWKSLLFGPAKQKSLSTMVLELYKELGIPTRGEYHMSPKYLGYYQHVTKDVSLKVASDIFVALHEAVHWADFSKLNGITNQIKISGDFGLIRELSDIHDKFYPGARKSAPLHTKISEGLTMYMQMKLYDPDAIKQFRQVTDKVFSPGGQYYGKVWDDLFNAFEKLKNDVAAMSPIMQAGLRIADMNTPKSQDYTIDTWNFLAKRLFKNYDESIPLSLWDDKAGVGFGTAMERTTDEGKLIQSAQNAYFFYRNRNRLASNWITSDPSIISAMLPTNPMFYDTNGEWTAGKYRMDDMIEALKKIEKKYPDLLTNETFQGVKVNPEDTADITAIYSNYLMMRRVFMDYRKRDDLELSMQLIIANGMDMYQALQAETDPDVHAAMLADFKSKFLRPFQVAFERWKRVNEIIGNEGGSYVELNADFSPTLLAWSSYKFRNLHSKPYNPNLGNIVTDANATQVYREFNDKFSDVDMIFDNINQTMLRMMVATGMLSASKANEYIQDNRRYPGYAAFQRYVSNTFFDDPELEQIVGSDNVGKIRSTMQRKGSTRDIIDPMLSQAVMIHEVFRKGLKNLMWLRLANMSRTDEQLARGFMPIPTKYIPQLNGRGEVIYMKPIISGKADIPGQVLVYANGVGKYWQIADESLLAFYNAITELDGGKWYSGIVNSRIYKAGVAAANMFTLMTTGIYPYWCLQNLTVDQLSSFMNSKLGTIPVYTSAKNFLPAFGLALGNTIGKQLEAFSIYQKMFPGQKPNPAQLQYITEFMSLGGSSQTMLAQIMADDQKNTVQELFEVKPKGILPKVKFGVTKKLPKVVTWTVDLTSLPTNISEIITKFNEYAQARKQGMKIEVGWRYSIETMPFPKRGASAIARFYFPLVSYLRSSFTVAGKTLEEAIDQPKKFATVWASVATAAAMAFINFWEDMEEDEKNYYLQADGTELAQYFIIPARFMGGPKGTMYRFRIPEIIGSANGVGTMYAIALSTNKSPEYKQMAKAMASNLPMSVNPYEWAAGDTAIASSAFRQSVRLMPQAIRPVIGAYSGITPASTGTRPITPRSLEFYPGEFQYRIGSAGTPSVVKDIYDNVTAPIGLSPIQTEYLLGEYFGRTGRFVLDYVDEKEIKTTFFRKREDYALRGRWYEDFYQNLQRNRSYFTVLATDRDPRPARGTEAFTQWKQNVEQYAKEYALSEHMGQLLSAAYKAREHGKVTNNDLPLPVYDKFDEAIKSFYDKEPYEMRREKMDAAYSALKEASKEIGYKDIEFFKYPRYSVVLGPKAIEKSMNKIFKP